MCYFRMATFCRSALAAVPAFAALAAIGLPARLDAQATVYHACYVPSSGTVYRIKEPDLPQQCGSSNKKGVTVQHVEFSWTDGQGGQSAPADHGALTGLTDDDHQQYLLAGAVRNSSNGFAVAGTYGQGGTAASGPGTRLMWYPGKAALRAGRVFDAAWDAPNVGISSVALGAHVIASGDNSVALGSNAFATGIGASAIGWSVTASGGLSTAMGVNTKATGNYATAIGEANEAPGGGATALGTHTIASGSGAAVLGNASTASGAQSLALGHRANTNGKAGAIVISALSGFVSDISAVADNQFVARAQRFWFGNNANVTAPAGQLIATSTGAYLTVGGAWVNSSDVNRKANFTAVAGEEVLGKVAALPIQMWNYRDEDASTRHMGPTAQDFRAAFGLGANETSIATVDADGVSLASIQALERRTTELRRDNESLRAQLQALTERLDAMSRSSRFDHR
jgi:hypothetical protein